LGSIARFNSGLTGMESPAIPTLQPRAHGIRRIMTLNEVSSTPLNLQLTAIEPQSSTWPDHRVGAMPSARTEFTGGPSNVWYRDVMPCRYRQLAGRSARLRSISGHYPHRNRERPWPCRRGMALAGTSAEGLDKLTWPSD
jgi:hypothetical protein